MRVLVDQALEHIGQRVKMQGWVKRVRRIGARLLFVVLRDRSGEIQLVLSGDAASIKLNPESVIEAAGTLTAAPQVAGGCELQVEQITVINSAATELPFEVSHEELRAAPSAVFDYRAFSLRHNRIRSMFKIQSEILAAFRSFLRNHDFTEIKTPKLVGAVMESGAQQFTLDYFGQTASLTQSPQAYKQMMVASGLERVFEIGPVFRAEKHKTSRHLNEYTSLDIEMGFIDSVSDLMDLEENLLSYIFEHLNNYCAAELKLWSLYPLSLGPIPRMKLGDAVHILQEEYNHVCQSRDIDPEGERLICEHVERHFGVPAVFLTEYPAAARPFYTMLDPENPQVTKSFDLIYRGLEITTGGQRIHQYQELKGRMQAHGLNPQVLSGYLEMFRLGMPPHGGFAIGLERLTAQILGLSNVKEACLFPRDISRLNP